MSIRRLGDHHFRVDLNESNIDYLSDLVLDTLLDSLRATTAAGEPIPLHVLEDRLRSILHKKRGEISERINRACDQALENTPTRCNRANLFGRALIQKIIEYPETTAEWLDWFKANYLKKFLDQVRIRMGVQNFDYFNELLDTALQNECMIRDLKQAHINWDAFFSHKRLALMLHKARNLRIWISTSDHQDMFLEGINADRPAKGVKPFLSRDLWHILDAWEYGEGES